MYTALIIAGNGSSGGADIQADLETMATHGIYGVGTTTVLTVQNTTGVTGVMEMAPEFLDEQLDNIFTDIFPDAVKIGMVSSSQLIKAIIDGLSAYHGVDIMANPVMMTISSSRFIDGVAIQVLKERLIPMVDLLTPSVPGAEILSGTKISSQEDMEETARIIGENCGCAVLCKGGHQHNDANDLLYKSEELRWFMGKRIRNLNTHGTGCTFSSAITSNLTRGTEADMAMERAKAYLSGAFGAMPDFGKGSSPTNHVFAIKNEYQREREYR